MIRELRLTDLGVIAEATISLGPGLTAITGETGAGKTMLLTGLDLLLGGRADTASVRRGASQAAVEGRLLPTGRARELAEDAGAVLDDDGELICVRTVAAAGRSRAHLGGRSVPMGLLGEIGSLMVTVHGQADQVRLRAPAQQRAALDAYAGADQAVALENLARAHEHRRALEAELEGWDSSAAERAAELDRLEHALNRIDEVEPVAGEIDSLREEADRLGNVEALLEATTAARAAFEGDERTGSSGAITALEQARRALDAASVHDPQLAQWSTQVEELIHLLNDLVTETGSYATGLEADPQRLTAVHERRAALTDLVRRYGTGDAQASDPLLEVLAFAEHARARVAELTAPGSGRDALVEQLAQARAQEEDAAATVTSHRQRAAVELAAAVDTELDGLAMRGAHLEVVLTPRPEISATGAEDVQLALQPHPDAPARPLAKGASGGELSRIMLALEVALAQRHAAEGTLPVFVFDEVDAGVGGRAATEVGRRLAGLARHTQVVVVTHLAQVAAFADTQLVVRKEADRGGVSTTVHEVTGTERELELARMLSGEESATARQHAAELLSTARSA